MAVFTVRPGVVLPDPQLVQIIQAAAANAPPGVSRVEIIDGKDARPVTPGSYHPAGQALDVQLYDQNGQPIYNEPIDGDSTPAQRAQTAQAFGIYQQFAQVAKAAQQSQFPNADMAWGGYFGLTGDRNAVDLMHFDLGGSRGTLGDFGTGLNRQGLAFLPGASNTPQVAAAKPAGPPQPLAYADIVPALIGGPSHADASPTALALAGYGGSRPVAAPSAPQHLPPMTPSGLGAQNDSQPMPHMRGDTLTTALAGEPLNTSQPDASGFQITGNVPMPNLRPFDQPHPHPIIDAIRTMVGRLFPGPT